MSSGCGHEGSLVRMRTDWPEVPPMVISENGMAWDGPNGPDPTIDDEPRVRYLHDHIAAVGDAIAAGVDVRGYLVWSLLDDFEWAWGYRQRFGIVHVDFATQVRTPRRSGWWFKGVIGANGLTG